jgi:hypothetical protein
VIRTVRFAVVLVVLLVGLTAATAPAAATGEDGLFGGDGDGPVVGPNESGLQVGSEVVSAGPGGAEGLGQEAGPETVDITENPSTPLGNTTVGVGAGGEGLAIASDPPGVDREEPVGNGIDGDADRGVTDTGDDGSTVVLDAGPGGGDAQVQCLENDAGSYCEKSGNVSLAVVGVDYEGYNQYDSTDRSGSFGDTVAVRVGGERVGTASVNSSDSPASALVGRLGGVGFGLFG